MSAYSLYDAIEERRDADEAARIIHDEQEAELSATFRELISPQSLQDTVIKNLNGKADALAVNKAFDTCTMDESVADFIQILADEVAFQQMIINDELND